MKVRVFLTDGSSIVLDNAGWDVSTVKGINSRDKAVWVPIVNVRQIVEI